MQSSSKTAATGASWLITAVFMLSNSPTPLYSYWQHQFGYTSGTLTVIFALYIAGLLGTLLFAGQLSDHYGRKPLLLPGLAAAMIASLLFATAESVTALAVARLLTGIAVGVMVSAGMAGVADLSGPQSRRQAALLASAAMVTGAGLGPLISGTLIQTLNHPVAPLFLLLFSALLVATVIASRLPFPPPVASAQNSFRLTLPSLPAKNLSALFCGIGAFAPGITATSFVLARSVAADLTHPQLQSATGRDDDLWHVYQRNYVSGPGTPLAITQGILSEYPGYGSVNGDGDRRHHLP